MASKSAVISREEIVESLQYVSDTSLAERDKFDMALRGALGQPSGPQYEIDPALRRSITDMVNDFMADSLMVGDRSQPLVTMEDMRVCMQAAYRSNLTSLAGDDAAILESTAEPVVSSLLSFVNGLSETNEKAHDRAWRMIRAYILLKNKYGLVDPLDEQKYNEFVRLSTVEAEWISDNHRLVEMINQQSRALVASIIDSLIDAMGAEDGLEPDEISEIKEETAELIDEGFDELVARIIDQAMAYRAKRFAEIWGSPHQDEA